MRSPCVLHVCSMCSRSQQLPPPVPEDAAAAHSTWASREPLEQQLAAWRHARLLEYSKELGLIERLQAELLMLREKVAQHGQSGGLGEAISGDHKLIRLNLKAWGCPPHSGGEAQHL